MKTKLLIILLALGASTSLVSAQDSNPRPGGPPPPREGGPGGPGGERPVMPIIAALDLNHDGSIDAGEIAKASASLQRLDRNGDGQITPEEYRPRHSGGPGGPGGRGAGPGDGGAGGNRPQRPRPE